MGCDFLCMPSSRIDVHNRGSKWLQYQDHHCVTSDMEAQLSLSGADSLLDFGAHFELCHVVKNLQKALISRETLK